MCVSIGLRLLVKPEFLMGGGGVFLLLNNANHVHTVSTVTVESHCAPTSQR